MRRNRRAKKFEREADKIEQLEKQVRELKSINRSLMKQLKKLTKGTRVRKLDDDEEWEDPIKRDPCSNCGKGQIEIVDIVGRLFEKCDTCTHRARIKKP